MSDGSVKQENDSMEKVVAGELSGAVEKVLKPVESPPVVKVVDSRMGDGGARLAELAKEVVRSGSRRLLWEYLRLRSRVKR